MPFTTVLTQLEACHHVLHGEKVGFGILVQLRLEERLGGNRLAGQAHRQLLPLLRQLGLPVCLDDLGLAQASLSQLQEVCRFACREGSDLHHLPFSVTPGALLEALVGAAELSPHQPLKTLLDQLRPALLDPQAESLAAQVQWWDVA